MKAEELDKKTLVLAPLNWGLGHVSRIVPLIDKYKREGWNIILASDGIALKFLQEEYPNERIVDIKSVPLRYSKHASLLAHLLIILPKFIKNFRADKFFIKQLVDQEKIDLIISDNRYGFRDKRVKSVFIAHQLQLEFPLVFKRLKRTVQSKISKWINWFDECWIIDDEQHRLAGRLSSVLDLKISYRYLGLQSRLTYEEVNQDIDFLIVLSGLEPQRSILENIIIEVFKDYLGQVIIIGGNFEKKESIGQIQYISFAGTKELNNLMNRSKCVISRSGFSSIMDLLKLKKKAILIPTPKQTEQEYLAKIHSENSSFRIAENNILSLQSIISNC